jgi:hypothetical protein
MLQIAGRDSKTFVARLLLPRFLFSTSEWVLGVLARRDGAAKAGRIRTGLTASISPSEITELLEHLSSGFGDIFRFWFFLRHATALLGT